MTTRWTIGIDWDRDGSYTDETARVDSAKWMLGFQQAYMDVGNDAQLRLLMRNEDKRCFRCQHFGEQRRPAERQAGAAASGEDRIARRHDHAPPLLRLGAINPPDGQSEWRTHGDHPRCRRDAIPEGDGDQDRCWDTGEFSAAKRSVRSSTLLDDLESRKSSISRRCAECGHCLGLLGDMSGYSKRANRTKLAKSWKPSD